MVTQTIKSQSPYFDDFDPSKDYVHVLFRPGYPVQARELTTLQSFLQEQIRRFGDDFYSTGNIVRNAQVTFHNDVEELILSSSANAGYPAANAETGAFITNVAGLVNKIITNADGSVKARVLPAMSITDTSKYVGNIYVQYITDSVFDSDGGYLYVTTEDNPAETQLLWNTYSTKNPASTVTIGEGLFYVDGHFVQVKEQNILISNSTNNPSFDVGLYKTEEIVTQNEDPTLFDNARGTTNEGAPGSHRLKLSLELGYKELGAPVSANFYRIATYVKGVKQEVNEISGEYANFIQLLAKRTHDESGDYAVTPFNPTLNHGDSDGNFEVTVSPAKAYVKGYEITKTAPTKIYLERVSGTKTIKNHSSPFNGTTSVEVTAISGTIPGSTTGTFYNPSNRVQLKNSAGQVIGVAKPWAIADENRRGTSVTKMFLYDIRMFTILGTDATFAAASSTGHDVKTPRASGYLYMDEGTNGVQGVTVIASTGRFRNGAYLESVAGNQGTNITSVAQYELSDVARITASNGFSATVTADSIGNENPSLFLESGKYVKTLKDASTIIMDNDFNVLANTGSSATVLDPANGFYDSTRVDDQVEVAKTLKFAYLKVQNATGSNFGWSAAHKEISLHYPDIYKVYKISETTDSTFPGGFTDRIIITTTGIIPQGSIVTGVTSGTKAIVALSNSSNKYEKTVASGQWHKTQTGTGSASSLEVVFTKGTAFTNLEAITVETPGSEVAYTYNVAYNGITAAVGTDITGNYVLDDGQRAEYYDIGKLIRKSNVPAPVQDIIVFFSYFEADPSTAHYYSADSYSGEYFYSIDPRFYGSTREINPENNNVGRRLRNGFDFRLRVKPVTDTNKSPFNFASRTFYDQDRLVPNTKFVTDFDEYLSRIDLISLEKNGQFKIVSGVPSTNPAKPVPSENGMALFYADISPVVLYPDLDVIINKVDNRRYTMRDIGELEMRINQVEENLQLTMLEVAALNDDNEGRTKSGFVVPNLGTEKDAITDTEHPEYNATIDILEKRLIPAQTDGVPIEMTVSSTSGISTFFNGYYMKSFTQEPFSTQLNATQGNRINPFATWTFEGDITLNPSEDNWRIRKDDYFTSQFGELKPFDGDAAAFQAFNRITTRSPGGRSTSVTQWIGNPKTTKTSSAPHTVPDWSGRRFRAGTLRQQHTETTTQAKSTVTTTTFDRPRSTGEVTTTKTGSQVIQNPQDYFMRSVTIRFDIKNLKPNTIHNLKFGEKIVGTTTSNARGEASGSFTVPAQTFPAGTQTVSVVDQLSGTSSFGFSQFKSIGHLDTFRTVASTATEIVTKSTQKNATKSSRAWFTDPIAQMFMLPNVTANEKETSIITSLDLWFAKVDKRAMMDTVKVEIRETVNGYPGGPSTILGETEYLYVDPDFETSKISNATAFNCKFKEPIVLRGGVEYAIVIKSPSDIMEVYVAEMGETLLSGEGIHSSQPNVGGYFGSFFKSQNSSTWTAEQSKDMTYRLYRAKFDDVDGTINMKNAITDAGPHKGDIGAYNKGLAMETYDASNYVKVYHPNHGFHYNGAQVTISGVDTTKTYNGLADSDLTGTFDVLYATLDSYVIDAKVKAIGSGKINTGTFTTFATQDIMFDSILTNMMASKEGDDEIGLAIQTTSTSPLNLLVSNNKIVNSSSLAPTKNGYEVVEIDALLEFEDPQIIRSATNASTNDLDMVITLRSGSQYTSPIIKAGSNLSPIVYRNIVGGLLTDSDIESLTTTSPDSENDDVTQEFVSREQAIQAETEHSAWVTKQIDLEIPADGITIKFDADMEPTSSVMAAYKARAIGDTTPFDQLEWEDFPYAQQVTEANYGEFDSAPTERTFTMYVPANFDFSSFKVRLRLNTENEAQLPRIKNLRVIADV